MMSMHIVSLKPSAFASGQEVQVSRFNVWKTVRFHNSNIKFRRFNCLPTPKLNSFDDSKEYLTKNHPLQRRKENFVANVAADFADHAHNDGDILLQSKGKSLRSMFDVWYRYSRGYTIIGSALSIISVSLLAIHKFSDFTPSFFLRVLQGIVGACLANLYVVGINQLSDVEIDKVNKPHLALPSGELSVKAGVLITSTYAILVQVFLLGWSVNSWPLKLGLFLWFAFGTAYSVDAPLLRWKKHPTLAAFCLWSVQGAIIPILFHFHALTNMPGRPLLLSKHAVFVSAFMSIFAIVIALFKDIPDVKGDKINGINSLALQIGQKRVFWLCIWLLEMAYGAATLIGLSSTHLWVRCLMVSSHSIIGFILWKKATMVDIESSEATESFYQFLWKLYYAEYLLVPFLRF